MGQRLIKGCYVARTDGNANVDWIGRGRLRVMQGHPADGPTIDLRLRRIGGGSFKTAYRTTNGNRNVIVLTKGRLNRQSYDSEILASCEAMAHIPRCSRIGYLDDCQAYEMPYFRPFTKANASPRAWRTFLAMRRAQNYAHRPADVYDGYKWTRGAVEALHTDKECQRGVLRAIEEILENTWNYGATYQTEFSQRNLGVTVSGAMVLLDIVFDAEAMRRGVLQENVR